MRVGQAPDGPGAVLYFVGKGYLVGRFDKDLRSVGTRLGGLLPVEKVVRYGGWYRFACAAVAKDGRFLVTWVRDTDG